MVLYTVCFARRPILLPGTRRLRCQGAGVDAFEAVVEVQTVGGAAGELSPGSELAVAAQGGLRGGKVGLVVHSPLLWLVCVPWGVNKPACTCVTFV